MKILIFGAAVDAIGSTELNWPLDEVSDVTGLKISLEKKYPALKQLSSLAIAVNEVYANDNQRLEEKDVVALIPPVSGG